jgi:hypothetical protein
LKATTVRRRLKMTPVLASSCWDASKENATKTDEVMRKMMST